MTLYIFHKTLSLYEIRGTADRSIQWRSYTWAHLGTGPGINLFGPGIKN